MSFNSGPLNIHAGSGGTVGTGWQYATAPKSRAILLYNPTYFAVVMSGYGISEPYYLGSGCGILLDGRRYNHGYLICVPYNNTGTSFQPANMYLTEFFSGEEPPVMTDEIFAVVVPVGTQ